MPGMTSGPTTAVVMMVMMTMAVAMAMVMPMPMRRMSAMIIHLMLQHVPNNGTTKRTQKAMILLVSEVISRGTAGKRTSNTTFGLGIGIGIVLLWYSLMLIWPWIRSL